MHEPRSKTFEEETLADIRQYLAEQDPLDRAVVENAATWMRQMIELDPRARLAVALVGAELAVAEAQP